MKIIAGLGNPGAEYAQTKHNVGFMLVDALAERLNAPAWKEDFLSAVTEVRIGGEKVFLVKPLTYMNNSGEALGPMLSYYKMDVDDLVVVHDDMDIPAGMVRIRRKGSACGPRGFCTCPHWRRTSSAWMDSHQSCACAVFDGRCAENSRGNFLPPPCGGVYRNGWCGFCDESLQST